MAVTKELVNVLVHLGPVIVLGKELECLGFPWVPGCWCLMEVLN